MVSRNYALPCRMTSLLFRYVIMYFIIFMCTCYYVMYMLFQMNRPKYITKFAFEGRVS